LPIQLYYQKSLLLHITILGSIKIKRI
jgi:hypothetical protein